MTKSYFATLIGITCVFLAIKTTRVCVKEFSCPDEIPMKANKAGLSFEGESLVLKSAVYKREEKDFKCLYHPKGLQRVFTFHAKVPAEECIFENSPKSKEKECTKPPCILKCKD